MKMLGLPIIAAAFLTWGAAGASAAPVSASLPGAISSDVVQVRNGCGAGLRWSNRRQRCVTDGAAVGAAVTLGVIGAIADTPRHRHHRRGHWRGKRRH